MGWNELTRVTGAGVQGCASYCVQGSYLIAEVV